MPRSNPIASTFWLDAEEWDPLQMMVFVNAFASEIASTSGIYRVTTKRISGQTHVPKMLVEHYLGVKPLSKEEYKKILKAAVDAWADEFFSSSPGYDNLEYDADNQVMFVIKKLSYKLGGRPDLIDKSIMGDHHSTRKAVAVWKSFARKYRKRIESSAELSAFFDEILQDVTPVEVVANEDVSPVKKPKKVPDKSKLEKEIDNYLARYAKWPGTDDRDIVFSVIRHLTTNLHTKKPITIEKQYAYLRRMSKIPVEQIIQASNSFIEGGCVVSNKRFKYFWGIVNGSAASWMIEYQNEKDKEDYKLDGGDKVE